MNPESSIFISEIFYRAFLPAIIIVFGGGSVVVGLYFLGSLFVMGKIKRTISIKIVCKRKHFDGLCSPEETIEKYGLAIKEARTRFSGDWGITSKGYLRRMYFREKRRIMHLETSLVVDPYVDQLSHAASLSLRGTGDPNKIASVSFHLDHGDLCEGHKIVFSKRMKILKLVAS